MGDGGGDWEVERNWALVFFSKPAAGRAALMQTKTLPTVHLWLALTPPRSPPIGDSKHERKLSPWQQPEEEKAFRRSKVSIRFFSKLKETFSRSRHRMCEHVETSEPFGWIIYLFCSSFDSILMPIPSWIFSAVWGGNMAEQRYPGNSLQQELNHPLGAADKLLTSPKASWISWLTDECVCLLQVLRAFSVGMKRFSHQVMNKDPKTTLTCRHSRTTQNSNLIFECVKHANRHVWYMMLERVRCVWRRPDGQS